MFFKLCSHRHQPKLLCPVKHRVTTDGGGHSTIKPDFSSIYLQVQLHRGHRRKFSSMESHWGHNPLFKANPIPSSRWPTQNELDVVFVDFCLIRLCLGIFNLTWFLLEHYGFQFSVFMGSVWVSCALSFPPSLLLSFFLLVLVCFFACSLKREKEGVEWVGEDMGRISEDHGEGNYDQNVLYEKCF